LNMIKGLLVLLAIGAGLLNISTVAVGVPALCVNRTLTPPVIDGKIGPEEWGNCASIGRFVRFGKRDLEKDATQVFVTYDKDNFYVAARCYQADKPVADARNRDESMWMDDCIEMFIQPDINNPTYYQFISNAIGNQFDGKGRDAKWDGTWRVKSSASEGFWEIEYAIPWKTVGVDSLKENTIIGANFCRNHPFGASKYAGPSNIPGIVSSTWSQIRSATYHDPSIFGLVMLRDNASVVKVNTLTGDPNSGFTLEAQILNPSTGDTRVKGYFEGTIDGVSSKDEKHIVVPAGKTGEVKLHLPVKPGVYDGVFVFTDESTGTTLQSQVFSCTIGRPLSVKAYWFAERITPLLDVRQFSEFTADKCEFVLKGSDGSSTKVPGKNSQGIWQGNIDVRSLSPGGYTLSAVISRGESSKVLDQIEVNKPATPEWYNCKLGLEDKLLPPWTPMKYAKNKIECWGREYVFNGAGFPSGIISQSRQILAGPVLMHAIVDGKAVTFALKSKKIEYVKDTRVALNSLSSGGGLAMSTRSEVEFDGMARFDTKIKSIGAGKIQELYMDIPLKKEASILFDADPTEPVLTGSFPYWRGGPGGLMPKTKIAGPFTPHIWIGNDDIGLVWFAESQKMWANKDQNKAIEIIPGKNNNILRIHYVDYPISAKEALAFTFGLQATPVKKLVPYKKFGMYSYYGAEIKRIPRDGPKEAMLTYPAQGNVNVEKGTVHLRVAPAFDPSRQVIEGTVRDPRGDTDYALFSVDFPNGDKFGLYFGITDLVIRAQATTGVNRQIKEQAVAQWRATDCKQGEMRDISLTWGDGKISIWYKNVKVSEVIYDSGVFTVPVSTARIRLGGSFVYDALKVTSDAYKGGDYAFDADPATTLLDNFSKVNTVDSVTVPEKSVQESVGKLAGTWTYSDGKLTLIADKRVDSLLGLWSSDGIDLMHLHENWTESEGYPKTMKHQAEIKSLAAACNSLGIKALPYIGFQLGDNTPEYAAYKEEIVVEPFVEERGFNRGDHLGQDICYSGQYQNFMIYNIDKMITDYGIGGLYMDGTCVAPRCENLLHGCGYYDRNGKLQPSYPVFEYRKFFKRIKTVGLSHRSDFWMDMHTTIGLCTPVSGFGDSFWKGEQFTMMVGRKGGIRDILNPDSIRTGMGKQYGMPVYFLNYDQMDECAAVCAILDIPLRLDGGLRSKVLRYFGTDSAKWVPYWKNSKLVKASDEKTYVSYWKRADGTVIAAISNLGKKTEPFVENIVLDEGKIGVSANSIASDATTGERFDYGNGTLKIKLTPWRYRLVLISPESVQKPIAAGTVWAHTGKARE